MFRIILLAHRYLGIAIGLVVSVWCLSGFVMMYMPYPAVSQHQLLSGLANIDLSKCCDKARLSNLGIVDVNRFTIEMLNDEPVIRIKGSNRQNPIVNLRTGEVLTQFDKTQSEAIASRYVDTTTSPSYQLVEQDQWTVTRFYAIDRPLHKFSFEDADNTEVYISSTRGKISQLTTSDQRFWNWLGAIPHWLYPTVLRQYDNLWEQTVIVLSVAGIFLTLFGLYLGCIRYKKLPSGRHSPYRGVGLWHHYVGLIFGIFILTWVTSGLFSMNPWQLFDLSGGDAEHKRVTGIPLSIDDVSHFVARLSELQRPEALQSDKQQSSAQLSTTKLPATKLSTIEISKTLFNTAQPIKRIEGYALHSELYFLLYGESGEPVRYSGKTLSPAPIASSDWDRLKILVAGNNAIRSSALIDKEDGYYYGHHQQRPLPVYRIIVDDEQHSRIYLNSTSGEIAGFYDQQQRWYRWLFSGLHQLDLNAAIRSRPVWDMVMWFLLLGVTLGTLTGTYMGIRRLFI